MNVVKSNFTKLINNPRTGKLAQLAKENWADIAVVAAVLLIAEDVDTAAEMAEASLTLDYMTAITEGVI